MTRREYSPEELDRLSLRYVALASEFHRMARKCRDNGIESLPLHDGKASQWLGNLEEWAGKSSGDLETQVLRLRAQRRARQVEQ